MSLQRLIVAILSVAIAASGRATAAESALNKEGFWTVGSRRGGCSDCIASLPVEDGGVLMLLAEDGEVSP